MKLFPICNALYPHFQNVSINDDALVKLIQKLEHTEIHLPTWKDEFCYHGDAERTLDWIFIFNAINYSYWNTPRWSIKIKDRIWGSKDEAFGVMAALSHAMESGLPLNDYSYLAQLDIIDLRTIFSGIDDAGDLPMLDQRLDALHELAVAFQRFGNAAGILRMCDYKAQKLVPFIVGACPSWFDAQELYGETLHFHKRAWLCAAMCYERFIDDPSRVLQDPETIPLFADYRLPQALRALGVLQYHPLLAKDIDASLPIEAESTREIEIRAATMVAASKILDALEGKLTALQLDAFLWTFAVNEENHIAPHHRTRTQRY